MIINEIILHLALLFPPSDVHNDVSYVRNNSLKFINNFVDTYNLSLYYHLGPFNGEKSWVI